MAGGLLGDSLAFCKLNVCNSFFCTQKLIIIKCVFYMDEINKIISLCKSRKVSTTVLADALNKTGLVPFVYPINSDSYKVGKIKCVFISNGSNYCLHDQISDVSKGDVVVVFTHDCHGKAVLGELVARYLIEKKGVEAIVVHGAVRDVEMIEENNYPIWCSNKTPIGCVNEYTGDFPEHDKKDLYEKYEGAVVICDSSGVIAIPKDIDTDVIIDNINKILDKEDVWFYCLDKLNHNTFQIICQKKYLDLYEDLPVEIQKKIDTFCK